MQEQSHKDGVEPDPTRCAHLDIPLENANLRSLLTEYRKTNSLLQKQIAATLGITREYYAQIEAGKRLPSVQLLRRICVLVAIKDSIFGEASNNELGDVDDEACVVCKRLQRAERELIRQLISLLQKQDHK